MTLAVSGAVRAEPAQLVYEREVLGFRPDASAGDTHPGSGVATLYCQDVQAKRRHAYEDFHALTLQLGPGTLYQLDRSGRPRERMPAGTLAIQPCYAETVWQSDGPTRWLQFYLPVAILNDCIETRGLDPSEVLLLRHTVVGDPALVSLLYRCAVATSSPLAPTLEELDALCTALADTLVENYSSATRVPERPPSAERLTAYQLARAREFIEEHLGLGLTASGVAEELGLSRFHFSRAFHGTTGEPPYRYIQRRRLAAALDEVVLPDASLADVAYKFGFASQGHMTGAFKAALGVSPREVQGLACGRVGRVARPPGRDAGASARRPAGTPDA